MENVEKTNEISLRELILKSGLLKDYLMKRWKVIFIAGLVCGIAGLMYGFFDKKVYTAELSFALEEKQMGGGALAGVATQFGLDMGKEGGPFSGDNIMELFKSRRIIANTLISEEVIDGKSDLLINRYIKFNELDKEWEEDERTVGLKFVAGEPKESYTRRQDSVLMGICEKIRKKDLVVDKTDKKLTIINVKLKSKDELFAQLFAEKLAANVYDFYIETKTKKTRANVVLLQSRVDSVRSELNSNMYSSAIESDQNKNLIKARIMLPQARRQMNIQLLTTLYAELVKNLEMSKLSLMREEPLIQVIDRPVMPLKFARTGKLKGLVLGGFIGVFFACLYLVTRRTYRNIMEKEDR